MKKRIPVDIQFLLESILAENPDQVLLGNRAARLISKGAKIKSNRVTADTYGAIPFYIDDASSVVVFSQYNQIHGSMEYLLRLAARKVMADVDNNTSEFDKKFEVKNMFGCIGLEYKSNTPTSDSSPKSNLDAHYSKTFIYFYGIEQNSIGGIKKYLVDNFEKLKKIQMRAMVAGKQGANELCGRVWTSDNVISFWNEKTKIDPHLNLVNKFMRQLDMNPNECVYEFIDGKNLFGYDDLEHDVSGLEKVSKEEIMNLLRTQHFNEKSKKELWNMLSPEEKNDAIKKHAKNFESPVWANAALPALEGHIKLKDLLKENPDKVDLKGGSGGDMKIARYQDSDAVAFFAFPNFGVYYEGGTHSDIINVLYNVYTELKLKISKYGDGLEIGKSLEDSYAFTKDYMMKSDVHVTDFDGMVRDMQSGPLKDFFDNENIHSDDDPGGFRTKSGGLSGRLWSRKKIVSFWNVREDVISKWNMIVQFFTQSAGKFGNLYEYKVDWLERDIRVMPMTPADEITSVTGSEDDQMDFLEKLSADAPPISPEELKELQKILHKLSPEKKKEALIKLGYKNTKYEERAAVADKLGMTVAEFNSIMNVNEIEEL